MEDEVNMIIYQIAGWIWLILVHGSLHTIFGSINLDFDFVGDVPPKDCLSNETILLLKNFLPGPNWTALLPFSAKSGRKSQKRNQVHTWYTICKMANAGTKDGLPMAKPGSFMLIALA